MTHLGGGRRRYAAAPRQGDDRGDQTLSGQAGMVTMETAMATPALAFVAVTLAWLLSLGIAHAQLQQAAREGARSAGRGDSDAQVAAVVSRVAPSASVRVARSSRYVVVWLSEVRSPPVGMLGSLGRTLRASATALREPE